MSIVLHIERLVIDESLLGAERVGAIGAAIELEMSRKLAGPGALATLRGLASTACLPPSALPVAGRPNERLGPRIARATLHGLGVESMPAASGRGQRR